MAIVRMKRIRLIAMTRDREELLRQLQRAGCVEICQPETDPADPEEWAGLTRPDGSALALARERQQTLSQAIGILRRWAPEKTGLLAPKPSISQRELADQEAYDQALRDAEEICGQERALAALEAERGKIEVLRQNLAPWLSLDVPLDISSTQQTAFQFGVLPMSVPLPQAQAAAGELAQLLPAGTDRTGQYALLVCSAEELDAALTALKELGWSRVTFRDMAGTALDNDRRLAQRLEEIGAEKVRREEQLAAMGSCRSALCRAADRTGTDTTPEMYNIAHTLSQRASLPI